MERSFQHRRTHHIAYKKTRQINVNAQIASIDFVRILHLFFLFSSSIRLFFPLYRSNFYESIDRANLWVKKNALYRITKLSRSMLMTKLHWLRSQVFFLFYFCRFHQLPPFDYSFDEYTHAYSDINFFTEPLIEQICG